MKEANILANKLYKYLKINDPQRISKLVKLYNKLSGTSNDFNDGISAIRGLIYFCHFSQNQILYSPL